MSTYTDVKNHTYQIKQSSLAGNLQATLSEEEIVEALYRIFDKR